MTEQAKVPEIRFAGFTDPWEQRKLGELALTYSGGTPSAGNSAYYGGEIPFIRSAEIDCDSTELSLTVAGLNNSSAKLVDKGMVLYAMYGATSGEVAISKIKGAINQAILAMDASDMAANRFIAYWLRRQKKSITETFLQGGQGNLSGAIIKELGIPQPSLDEQRQIGSFFSNLDDLITLHQRKYDKLVVFKKSMLEKMFPKDGESVPEIRFAGFTDPWEQRKLGELTESYSGGTPAAGESEFYGGSIPFIRSAEIAAESTELFLTEKGYESSSARMVKPGDVLYALYGATSGEVAVSRQKGAINQAILAILPRDDCDARYITAWLRKQKGYIVTTYLQGGQGNLSGVIVKNLEVSIPSLPEQQKIGFMLSHLDSLITLHQRKLELLQNIKKSLLDKMFV